MVGLLIVISFVGLGKTLGQLPPVSVAVVLSVPLDPLSVIQGQDRFYAKLIQPNSMLRTTPTDESRNSDLNLRSSTSGDNQMNRRLFIAQTTMENPNRGKIETDYNTRQNTDSVVIESSNTELLEPSPRTTPLQHRILANTDANMTTATDKFQTHEAEILHNEVHQTKLANGTTEKTPQPRVKAKAIEEEVTLDERASFDGSKCPTGTVRFNGICVEKV